MVNMFSKEDKDELFYYIDDPNDTTDLIQGPLPKSIYTYQLETVIRGILHGTLNQDNLKFDGDKIYIKWNDSPDDVYDLTTIMKYANLDHLTFLEQDHDAYQSLLLNKRPDKINPDKKKLQLDPRVEMKIAYRENIDPPEKFLCSRNFYDKTINYFTINDNNDKNTSRSGEDIKQILQNRDKKLSEQDNSTTTLDNLHLSEMLAVNIYSGTYYKEMQNFLRTGTIKTFGKGKQGNKGRSTQDFNIFANILCHTAMANSALNKMPKHDQVTLRGESKHSHDIIKSRKNSAKQPNAINGFMSTSEEVPPEQYIDGVRIAVQCRAPKITAVSVGDENEVTLKHGTQVVWNHNKDKSLWQRLKSIASPRSSQYFFTAKQVETLTGRSPEQLKTFDPTLPQHQDYLDRHNKLVNKVSRSGYEKILDNDLKKLQDKQQQIQAYLNRCDVQSTELAGVSTSINKILETKKNPDATPEELLNTFDQAIQHLQSTLSNTLKPLSDSECFMYMLQKRSLTKEVKIIQSIRQLREQHLKAFDNFYETSESDRLITEQESPPPEDPVATKFIKEIENSINSFYSFFAANPSSFFSSISKTEEPEKKLDDTTPKAPSPHPTKTPKR